MMYPRLALLKQFLSDDGSIWIFLDDNEVQALRYVMDEIFGANNFVATVLWQKVFAPKNSAKHFSEDHDYLVVYAKKAETWRPNLIPRSAEAKTRYKNSDNDPRGPWTSGDLQARNFYSEGTYPITCQSGRVIPGPGSGMYWRVAEAKFKELDRDKRIYWGPKGDNMPRLKRFLSEVKDGIVPQTLWTHSEVGHTQEAKKELLAVLDFESSDDVFITPKPTRIIERALQIATNPGDLVLDSFAGSGTTGHAVLKLNAAQRSRTESTESTEEEKLKSTPCPPCPPCEPLPPRRFIMVEVEDKVATEVTRERVRRVAEGYTNAKGEAVAGLGGGFRFCELGEPLFDESGHIRETVKFGELARHVYFTETGEPLPGSRTEHTEDMEQESTKKTSVHSVSSVRTPSPLLGICRGIGIYLLFNGILGDKTSNGGNVLTRKVLAALPPFAGPKVIYCAGCLIGAERLAEEGITIRQTPYEIRVS